MFSDRRPFSCQAGRKAADEPLVVKLSFHRFNVRSAILSNLNNQAVMARHLIMDQHESSRQSVSSTFLMDASLTPLKRTFKWLNGTLHERLPFSTAKTAHSLSTVFDGSRWDLGDQQKIVVESEPNLEKSCTETRGRFTERLYDDGHESVVAYLVVCGVIGQKVGLCGLRNAQRARFVSIPDSVEELCEKCFCECKSLSRVTFGESSSLKLIGKKAFLGSGVVEIHIPDSVEGLCEKCFYECRSLSRVTFGDSSSLKLIGKEAFLGSGVVEIHIPDRIERLLTDRITALPPQCLVRKLT